MKVKVVYPVMDKVNVLFLKMRRIASWLFLLAAGVCVIVNIATKGKAWSAVVVWSLWSVWNLVFSPDSIEFNLISQIVKAVFFVIVLLALIDFCLAPGWAMFVIPIICFAALIVTTVILLIDYKSQLKNTMPMMWLVIFSLVLTVVSFTGVIDTSWPVIVLGSIAFSVLLLFVFFHNDFVRELKKRFHTN